MSTIATLNSQLAAAKTELESALSAGEPTRTIRSEISRIEAELTEARNAEAGAQRAQAQQDAAAVQAASTDLAEAAQDEIETATAVPELIQLGEDVPAIEADPQIAAAAHEVVQARAGVEKAERALAPLQAAVSKLQTRISEEQAQVATIKQRRSAGDRREDDAGAMTLLADDIADLERLLSVAQTKVVNANATAAYQALATAEQRLTRVRGEALMRTANDRLQLAEKAFMSAYAAQRAAERVAGLHHSFPSGTYRAGSDFKNLVSRH